MITVLNATTPVKPTPAVNPFNDDMNAFEQEFSGLNAVEQEVNARQITYSDLVAEKSELVNNLQENQDLGAALLGAKGDDTALGIPGFWWGCVLGLLGVLIVFLVVDDSAKKAQVRKALIGCVVGGAVYVLLYFLLWGVIFASSVQ